MSMGKYLLAASIGAAAATIGLVIIPAGATTLATLGAAGIIAGGMITSAHIAGNASRNVRNRRYRRPWQQDQVPNHAGSRSSGNRHIDPI